MKKHILNLTVVSNTALGPRHALLRLTDPSAPLPPVRPGQFAQVQTGATFLRRPISLCFADHDRNELTLLVQTVGEGSRWLANRVAGDIVNLLLPLGNGFTLPPAGEDVLLIGGGVGVAPLLLLGKALRDKGCKPTFLLGARSADGLLMLREYENIAPVLTTTEDGSHGERGFVTNHSVLAQRTWAHIACCGPKPMMVAVSRYAEAHRIADCQLSLENMMACGLGACLCCVEDTRDGHRCVCTDGPVFQASALKW